jgi:peptidoglycan/LPS O-acetylase OafA/YrhL
MRNGDSRSRALEDTVRFPVQEKTRIARTHDDVDERSKADAHGMRSSGIVSRLRRITTSGLYVPEIDGLRFIAIISVVFYHITGQTGIGVNGPQLNLFWRAVSNGFRGVPLFFVISGFILGLPFAHHYLNSKAPVSLKSYFMRRITRLEPPYMLVILLRAAILILVIHRPLRIILPSTMASLFYLHTLVFGEFSIINPPAWSLEIEIQFYCLAPLIAYLCFINRSALVRRCAMIAVILSGCVTHDYLSVLSPRLEWSIVCNLQYFLAGFLLVDFYVTDWDRIPKHLLWDVVSIACWLGIFLADESWLHLLLPVLIIVVYIAAFKGPISSLFFRLSWISLIGGMCYSIYLTHTLAISTVDRVAKRLLVVQSLASWERSLLIYAVSLVVVVAVGMLLYVLVERPCMGKNWPTKLLRFIRSRFGERESAAETV